jgi:FAD/FMN-containing dehydrogenase
MGQGASWAGSCQHDDKFAVCLFAGGVGLIGIITEVKLQMTPPSNTKAVSINLLPDTNIAADVTDFLQVQFPASVAFPCKHMSMLVWHGKEKYITQIAGC